MPTKPDPAQFTPAHILTTDAEFTALLSRVKTVAVLGIKPESRAAEPSHYVPAYVASRGLRVYPVPVYYPEVTAILGQPVYRSLAALPERVDLVDVFRRPADLEAHADDLLAAKPRAVWLQSGIRHDAFAARLVAAGISVVQDRCLMVELRRLVPG